MSKLVDLCAVLMKLRPQLRGVPVTYWPADLEPLWSGDGSGRQRADRIRGKWEVSVAAEYGGMECEGIGDTPEAAVQDAIDNAMDSERKSAEKALLEAGKAAVRLQESEALARGVR